MPLAWSLLLSLPWPLLVLFLVLVQLCWCRRRRQCLDHYLVIDCLIDCPEAKKNDRGQGGRWLGRPASIEVSQAERQETEKEKEHEQP